MLEEENTLELVPVLDEATGKYVVRNYDNAKKIVQDFIEREVNAVIEINDDIALKSVKATRTDIRKKKDAITQARIHVNAILLGDFNGQLKEIETMLDNADKELKAKVDTYNSDVKGKVDNKPRVITLVVKAYDMKPIEKVKKLALELGLATEVK